MTKSFYLSYTRNITSTLQPNLTRVGVNENGLGFVRRFALNYRMLVPVLGEDDGGVGRSPGLFLLCMVMCIKPVRPSLFPSSLLAQSSVSNPLLPIELTVLNRVAYVAPIARGLHHFAGARYI